MQEENYARLNPNQRLELLCISVIMLLLDYILNNWYNIYFHVLFLVALI